MSNRYLQSLTALRRYCEKEEFKGWDPYDGLNSQVLRTLLPLKRSALLRLCVIQGFKRCPVNLRRLALVPKQHNAKGIGLFLQGYCNLWRAVDAEPSLAAELGDKASIESLINRLAELLLSMCSQGDYHGACWGYNFDWQCRREFLFERNTPTVVATTFCATALMEAYEVTHRREYLDVALSSAEFVMHDLHRVECEGGFLFSYSPQQGNDTVFNASLLGSKLLACCYHYTGNEEYCRAARSSVEACCAAQRPDGSWFYGMLPVQEWIDSFHTGYNLDALAVYRDMTDEHNFDENIRRGFEFYIDRFFCADGTPRYYHDRTYPIDIHCPGQLPVTLARLDGNSVYGNLAARVLDWTISHMQHPSGYFCYQLKQGISSRISYMRWSNAFMFNSLSFFVRKYRGLSLFFPKTEQ